MRKGAVNAAPFSIPSSWPEPCKKNLLSTSVESRLGGAQELPNGFHLSS